MAQLVFFAEDAFNGREFWSMDGTTAGVHALRLNPGTVGAGDEIWS